MNKRLAELRDRLLCDFPEWSNAEALRNAELIVAFAEREAFVMDVEADLSALSLTTEREAAHG